ncbi:MAG: DUF924 family protein [Pseudomonadota bacterium]|jgi:uncharacterized protein (DUF924 family)|nr:DUF924 family protein [Pseudomonadota bacterium]
MKESNSEVILDFWFQDVLNDPDKADARLDLWFKHHQAFDDEIQRRFGTLPDTAYRGQLQRWPMACEDALALTLVLDQFPRNLFRKQARAYAYDTAALEHARETIKRGCDRRIHPLAASFLYLPFEHAEDIYAQDASVALYERLVQRSSARQKPIFERFLDFAHRHRQVITRFGRFPHRNWVLGRISTDEELEYLDAGGEDFSDSSEKTSG